MDQAFGVTRMDLVGPLAEPTTGGGDESDDVGARPILSEPADHRHAERGSKQESEALLLIRRIRPVTQPVVFLVVIDQECPQECHVLIGHRSCVARSVRHLSRLHKCSGLGHEAIQSSIVELLSRD